ncbi:MAG TPA: response regulator [Vicinamibacterales bacterium]|nr:response regulator [Vicinamibacterales bacterium]
MTTPEPPDPDRPAFLVLLVDDHHDSRELYATALKRFGFSVRTAATGRQALEGAAEAPQPSLIVLDLRLPDLSGRDVFRRLREEPVTAGIPVIAMSADAREMELALTLGFAGFCPKPCAPDTLVRAVVSVLMPRVTARHAAPAGGPVTVSAAPGGGWWEVRVGGKLAACWPSEFAARAAARQYGDGTP